MQSRIQKGRKKNRRNKRRVVEHQLISHVICLVFLFWSKTQLAALNAALSGGRPKFGIGGIRAGVKRAGVKFGPA